VNRHERRHLSATPSKGSEPVRVSREVPVVIIAGAGGAQEVVEVETAEPCYGCKCCVLWTRSVDTLRLSMIEHEEGLHADCGPKILPIEMFPGCLVCQLLGGAADGRRDG
jgi:hypothetical protein